MTPLQLSAATATKATLDAVTYEAAILSTASTSGFKVFVNGYELSQVDASVISAVRATLLAHLQSKMTSSDADLAAL
jgi:hypothetical protein